MTRLLQDSLGGNSKTSLIITVSPAVYNCTESISSLRFGQSAKMIKNKVSINQNYSVDELMKKLLSTEEENESLKK